MKKLFVLAAFVLLLTGLFIGWGSIREATADMVESFFTDPDMGENVSSMSKEEFMMRRSEEVALKRGVEPDKPFDPQKRISAIKDLERMEDERRSLPESSAKDALLAAWTEIGPNPIPNGQVVSGPQLPVSGRVISIAIHPTNPDLVYVGTAQGGLYRTNDGGTTWTSLMDNALSLAIGAIAIAPSQPETIYVGTGEHNFSADSYFGVGVYRIDNASTAATVTGPLNKDAVNSDVFTGRGISRIVVHPTDPATIFVASTNGVGGLINTGLAAPPVRGIYRSANATSASPVFERLTGLAGGTNASVRDIAIDPANPNFMLAGVSQVNVATNGIYVSNNALAPSPTFDLRQEFTGASTSDVTSEFAVNRTGQTLTLYAAVGNGGGRVLRSTDNGVTWTQQIDNNFCTPQCFYNIAFAVDPTDANRLYLGGVGTNTTFTISTNGGTTFTSSASGLHTDSHVVVPAPSLPSTVYFGSDGGIYKSVDSGTTWASLNNTTFKATQFMGLAVHPTDPNFTLGGTQDNGTNFYSPTGTWTRIVGGDGGYSIIDTNATNTTAVNMYHSFFFNSTTQQIYRFASNGLSPTWTQRGCTTSGATVNGITCNGTVRFYAPLEQGPGNPNTIYYGSDRLYRSADTGLTHTVVSQNPIVTTANNSISAIGISPQNDNVRVVGLSNGALWGTTTGSSTLVDLDPLGVVPNGAIARVVIDPQNAQIAYLTLSSFGVTNVWKTSNLSAAPPTWTPASTGLPTVPVNSLVVDPAATNILYAGTDIGVFISTDAGVSWNAFGTGLPRVAVFDLAKTAGNLIRIATHGRGMWQTPAFSPAALPVTISGRVTTPGGQGLRNAVVSMTDPLGVRRVATTSSFGIYTFDTVTTGQAYIFGIASKRFRFTPQTINVTNALANLDFVGLE